MPTPEKSEPLETVAVIGAGSWGTAVAALIAENHPHMRVLIWAYEKQVADSINRQSVNTSYLPGISLPPNLKAVRSIREALSGTRAVIIATPSRVIYDTCRKVSGHLRPDACVGFLSKGFCKVHGKTLTISETISVALPETGNRIAAISGPTHAEEVAARLHSCISIGSPDRSTRRLFSRLISSAYMQCRETDDIRGVELGGALKNPAAIAAGMISALPGCGDNLSGALISEALKEILKVSRALGARDETLIDICGLGDLVATALSPLSRNRRFGKDIATRMLKGGQPLGLFDRMFLFFRPGRMMERMTERLNYLAEGAYAIEPLMEIAGRRNVALPLYRSLYEVLLNRKDPSLLVETIKDPRRFEDLYEHAAFQPLLSRRDIRKQPGTAFKKPVLDALSRSAVISEDRDGDIKRASEMFDRMADRYGTISSLFAFGLFSLMRSIPWAGRRQPLVSAADASKTGRGGKNVATGDTPVYIITANLSASAIEIALALRRSGMPVPRFWLELTRGREVFRDFLLRHCGGFFVDRSAASSPLYRELLASYLSFLVSHRIPVLLHRTEIGQAETDEMDETLMTVLGSILDTHEPVQFYPLSLMAEQTDKERSKQILEIGRPVPSMEVNDPAELFEKLGIRD